MKKYVTERLAYKHITFGYSTSRRSERGAVSFLALAAIPVVILLGAFSFDLFVAREQFNQLQAATDAAALATADYLTSPTLDTAAIDSVGLAYFQMNSLNCGQGLSSAALNASAATDSPAAGVCEVNISTTQSTCTATVTSAFGIRPTLLSFIGTFPIHTTSTAAPSVALTGDICLCIDYSDSMWCNEASSTPYPFPQYTRRYWKSAKTTTYALTCFLQIKLGPFGNRKWGHFANTKGISNRRPIDIESPRWLTPAAGFR